MQFWGFYLLFLLIMETKLKQNLLPAKFLRAKLLEYELFTFCARAVSLKSYLKLHLESYAHK